MRRSLGIAALAATLGCTAAVAEARVQVVGPEAPVRAAQDAGITASSTGAKKCRLITRSPGGDRRAYPARLKGPENLLAFTIAAKARRGSWKLVVACGKSRDATTLRVQGGRRSGRAPLLTRSSLRVSALDHGPLDPSVIPSALEQAGAKERGGPDPDFRLPFPCGEQWSAATYPGHGSAVDFNAPGEDGGRPVVASADGTAHPQPPGYNGGYGNYVVVVHGGGWTTLYAHLAEYSVRDGQTVARGTQLGTVGTTGKSTGNHLHFEQRLAGVQQTVRFSDGQIRFGDYRSDNCGQPTPPPPPPPPSEVRKVITVDNRVTNGGGMREDGTPVRLQTRRETFCGSKGCNIAGTERTSGQSYDAAVCQAQGQRTTNGHDTDASDDGNPERFESTRYYGVRLSDGTFGFVSEVWIRAADRGGLDLPACP